MRPKVSVGPEADIGGTLALGVARVVVKDSFRRSEWGNHRVVEGRDLPYASVLDEDAQT